MNGSESSTILIVDDDRGGREALEALLLTQGYTLLLAANGPEALRKLAETPVDLLLLDVMMPGMDGYEVCRRIRATPAVADVPVLMLTALNDYRSRLAGFDAGADDYISKPYDTTELFARVRTITRLNRFRRLVAERLKFQQLFALSPNGQIVVDASGVVQLINQKTLEMLKVQSVAEVEGSSLSAWIVEEDRQELQAILEKCFAQPIQSFQLETGLARTGQEMQPVELLLGPIEYNGQSMIQVIMVDIRERLEMEGDLSREKILFRTLVDALPDYFFIKDMQSRIIMANSAMACLFGFDGPDAMFGKTDYDLYPAELAGRYLAEEKQLLACGKPILDRQEPLVDQNGNWLIFSITKVPLYNPKNEVVGLMGIGRDVSRQDQAARDLDTLKAQQKAMAVNIENLQQALAASELESRQVVANLEKQVCRIAKELGALASQGIDPASAAAIIGTYTEAMQGLAEDLRQYSELQAAKETPGPGPFSIPGCIESAVSKASPEAEKKGITIRAEMSTPFPDSVSGDSDSLGLVISRLLKNAIRMSSAGEVVVNASLENYNPVQPGGALFLHVAVSDCGKGISKQDMSGYFLPFYQPIAMNGTSGVPGLELAICKALVRRAGGGIWVENKDEPETGAIVHFSFPLFAI